MVEPQARLESWKEIASYLGRDIRTVQRWELEAGLPVHRIGKGRRGGVHAFAAELDAWRTPAPPVRRIHSPTKPLIAAASAGLLATVLAAAVIWMPRHRTVATVRVDQQRVTAFDSSGRTLWSYLFPTKSGAASQAPRAAVGPVDGSGRLGAVVSWLPQRAPDSREGALLALGADGRPRWSRTIDDALHFRNEAFAPPWLPSGVTSYSTGKATSYVWLLHHHTWWPSMLVSFDTAGRMQGRFVNAGWLLTASVSPDHRWLIAGGFSNSREGAAFVVLPASDVNGASPEDSGSPFECENCPAGRPFAYYVLPWSDVAQSTKMVDRSVAITTYTSGNIELHALQNADGAEIILELSHALDIVRYGVSDAFLQAHRRLEAGGTIAHDAAHCPAVQRSLAYEWTHEGGWRTAAAHPPRPTRSAR